MISTDEGYMRLEYFSENVAADKKMKRVRYKKSCIMLHKPKARFSLYWGFHYRVLGAKCIFWKW